MTPAAVTSILLIATLIPFAFCQDPTDFELLHDTLIPDDLSFQYMIKLFFQDDEITIPNVCNGNVTVRKLSTEVHGMQAAPGETSLAISPCTGLERNLGTAIYRVEPRVTIVKRVQMTRNWFGRSFTYYYHTHPDESDRFCLFMFDAGLEELPFALPNRPFIHWAVCNIKYQRGERQMGRWSRGLGSFTGQELMPYFLVPGTDVHTRRIVWVLLKQDSDDPTMSTDGYVPPVCPAGTDGRCAFDVVRFITDKGMEVVSVLTTRAAPDVVGMNMLRGVNPTTPLTSDEVFCDLYTDLQVNYAPAEDGYPYGRLGHLGSYAERHLTRKYSDITE